MNATKCPHSADGWCLDCVNGAFRASGETTNKFRDEADALRAEVEGLKAQSRDEHSTASDVRIALEREIDSLRAQLATAHDDAVAACLSKCVSMKAYLVSAGFSGVSVGVAKTLEVELLGLKKNKGGGA